MRDYNRKSFDFHHLPFVCGMGQDRVIESWFSVFIIARPCKGGRENEQTKRRRHKHRQTVRTAKTLWWALYLICFWRSLCISALETHLGQLVQIAHFTFLFCHLNSDLARASFDEGGAHQPYVSLCVYVCEQRINLTLMDFHSFCSREVNSHPLIIRSIHIGVLVLYTVQ